MADPFGIVGVVSLTVQITQIVVQFVLDWKDASHDIKSFRVELQTLKTVLSETHTNLLLNPDFVEAFQNRPSILLSQLGPNAPPTTDAKLALEICEKELKDLLTELKRRSKGHRVGWERVKGAFLAKTTRESVKNLHRQCQALNSMASIDTAVLGATTYREVKEIREKQQQSIVKQQETRKEQWDWHHDSNKLSLAIKGDVDQLIQGQEDLRLQQEQQVILDWLTPVDYAPQQSDFIGRRHSGTGEWLLNSNQFQGWIRNTKQTMFCPGMPGAGKTIITSIVIDHLWKIFRNDATVGIAYLYCNFQRQYEQRPVDLLASLLKQLIQKKRLIPETMKSLYERHKDERTRPSVEEVSNVLHSIVAGYSKTFIIIDALDECQIKKGSRKGILSETFNLQARTAANIFATSRFISEIAKEFNGSVSLEIRASNEDVRNYLKGHISRLPSCVTRSLDLQEEIETKITKAVEGMFLLAQLHLDSLIDKTTPRAIRRALEQLPKGSDAINRVYEEAMQRIQSQEAGFQELARRVLSWITCTKRPLTTLELRHALAVEVGDSELGEDNLQEIEDMVSTCAGLVTVDEESDIIRLIHYTVQQYFEQTQKNWFPDAQRDIATTCVIYLSFNTFEAGFCLTDKEFKTRLQLNPLYDYAARNWGHHARAASTETEQLILDLLESESKVSGCSQAMMAFGSYSGYSMDVPRQMTGAHLAAYFGLEKVMNALLMNGYDPDPKDTHNRTPLSRAAENGHETVVKLLLANGVNTDSKGEHGLTPLSWAALNGQETVVKLLLAKNGVDPDSKSNSGLTPLSWAAKNGHKAVVKLLLTADRVDVNSKDIEYGRTPLSQAAENGHETVVKLLLAADHVDPDSKDTTYRRTPLSRAAENGHEAVVKLLLAADRVELNSKSNNGQTPLSWAARYGHKAVVKLLLAMDRVDPDSKDKDGWTPLAWAAKKGQEAVVKLLLAKDGVDPDSNDRDGLTPLSWATKKGQEAVIKLLLTVDRVDPDSKNNYGRTPLSWAAENGEEAVVKLLLAKDVVDPDSKSNSGRTPLSEAAQYGKEAVVKLLLAKDGVDPSSKDEYGGTPLSWAAWNGQEAVVKLLLAKDGVDPDCKSNSGGTPLSRAAENGHEAVVKLLLAAAKKRGVEIDFKDISLEMSSQPTAQHRNKANMPAEVIPPNLDFADYWIKSSVQRDQKITVTQRDLGKNSQGKEVGLRYLSSAPIGIQYLSEPHPVRKIVFTITSKDQGWSSYPESHGTYHESWTWFEAVIRNETDGPSKGMKIVSNVHAGQEYKTHVVTWTFDTEDEDERTWVRSLRRGQHVDITVLALYTGWENHVAFARMDIFTAKAP